MEERQGDVVVAQTPGARTAVQVCSAVLVVVAALAGCAQAGTGSAQESRPPTSDPAPMQPGTTSGGFGSSTSASPPAVTSATTGTVAPTTPTTPPTTPAASPSTSVGPSAGGHSAPPARALVPVRPGQRGAAVLALQRRLSSLGYWLGTPDGSYGDLTRQAVTAMQKVAGLHRDGVAGSKTIAALARAPRPHFRSTSGHAVEVDVRHQVLMVVDAGRVRLVLNTSTGSGRTYVAPDGHTATATTPHGIFSVAWSFDGWRTSDLGQLYRPRYFHPRGIAVHGALSVPSFPASHGCVRVSPAAMDMIWRDRLMPLGSTVIVY